MINMLLFYQKYEGCLVVGNKSVPKFVTGNIFSFGCPNMEKSSLASASHLPNMGKAIYSKEEADPFEAHYGSEYFFFKKSVFVHASEKSPKSKQYFEPE